VVGVLLGFVILPNGRLLSVAVPLVLARGFPAVDARLVNVLIRRLPQNQRLLFPNANLRNIESGIGESTEKLKFRLVGVEDIHTRIIGGEGCDVLESGKEELIELFFCHVVVLDCSGSTFVVDVVGWVGNDKISFRPSHQ